MAGADVLAKAHRYLAEGRVQVQLANAMQLRVTVQGSEPYRLEWVRRDGWHCSCPARRLCAHLVAAQLVTGRDVAEVCRQEVA